MVVWFTTLITGVVSVIAIYGCWLRVYGCIPTQAHVNVMRGGERPVGLTFAFGLLLQGSSTRGPLSAFWTVVCVCVHHIIHSSSQSSHTALVVKGLVELGELERKTLYQNSCSISFVFGKNYPNFD
jgi:hypothetical protein